MINKFYVCEFGCGWFVCNCSCVVIVYVVYFYGW